MLNLDAGFSGTIREPNHGSRGASVTVKRNRDVVFTRPATNAPGEATGHAHELGIIELIDGTVQ